MENGGFPKKSVIFLQFPHIGILVNRAIEFIEDGIKSKFDGLQRNTVEKALKNIDAFVSLQIVLWVAPEAFLRGTCWTLELLPWAGLVG